MKAAAPERRALLLADEPERATRYLDTLRRTGLAVTRAATAGEAEWRSRDEAFTLIVLFLPVLGAERLLAGLRSPGCASREAGVVVVGTEEELLPGELELGRHANRILPGDCDLLAFQQDLNALLDVQPRVPLPEGGRLELTLHSGERVELWLENVSTSGMLMRALAPLAVGTVFGFALELENEPMPIRGRARVVRLAGENAFGHVGLGARFLALGGEGPQRLERVVERSLAAGPAPGDDARSTPAR
jgi:hypothetical protein